jgi:hypothetical protein
VPRRRVLPDSPSSKVILRPVQFGVATAIEAMTEMWPASGHQLLIVVHLLAVRKLLGRRVALFGSAQEKPREKKNQHRVSMALLSQKAESRGRGR